MSCFVVDYKDVDNMLVLCRKQLNNNIYFKGEFERMFCVNIPNYDYRAVNDLFTEIGRNILKLNLDAYYGKYNETLNAEDESWVNDYKFNDELKVSDMQALKSLHCIIYQCSEDGADNQKLYKQLVELKNKLHYYLLCNNEEYDNAKWGDCYEFASR